MSAAGDGDGDDYCDAAAELRQFQGSILPNFLLGSSFETESLSATLFGGYNAKNFSPLSCFFAASSLFAAGLCGTFQRVPDKEMLIFSKLSASSSFLCDHQCIGAVSGWC